MASLRWLVLVEVFCGIYVKSEYPNFDNLDTDVYSTVSPQPSGMFFRLANHQKQIGSSTGTGSVQGVLWYIKLQSDMDRLLKGSAPYAPYIALIDPGTVSDAIALTSRDNLLSLSASERVSGVIINHVTNSIKLGNSYSNSSFSPLTSCDNNGFGWEGTSTCSQDWNTFANDLLFKDFKDFPIMLIKDISVFKKCFDTFMKSNSPPSYPLCSAELTGQMRLPVNTETCYRRANLPMSYLSGGFKWCDPLGGLTPWGTLFSLPNTTQDVVMVTTKLDTLAMFPRNTSLGGGEVAGIVVLLAVSESLGRLKRENILESTNKTIVFTLFNGESWDYIGSSRIVFDMTHGAFSPFNHLQISHFVELSHLGFNNNTLEEPVYYAHLHKGNEILDQLKLFGSNVNLRVENSTVGVLPPSSLLRFLKVKSNISSVVLGDYNGGYLNRFYGSRFDDINNLLYLDESLSYEKSLDVVAGRLANISTMVANTLLNLSDASCSNDSCNPLADQELVKDLIECFLRNFSCKRFQEAIPDGISLPNSTVHGYVGTYSGRNSAPQNYLPEAVRNLLSYYMGNWFTNVNKTACLSMDSDGYSHRIFSRGPNYNSSLELGTCVLSNTYFHEAVSPVFKDDGYQSNLVGEYASWTESVWGKAITIRLYITAGIGHDIGVFFCGIVMFGFFVLLSIQLHRKGRKLFPQHQQVATAMDVE